MDFDKQAFLRMLQDAILDYDGPHAIAIGQLEVDIDSGELLMVAEGFAVAVTVEVV